MNDKTNTFERLVLTLESTQRQDMLRQLADMTERQEEETAAAKKAYFHAATDTLVPDTKLNDEPFLVRLWFTILAFFSSSSPSRMYSEYLVTNLGKRLNAVYGLYIDARKNSYSDEFYQELAKLKKTQVFFSNLLVSYENDKSSFILILASLLIKDTCDAIQKAIDPFSVPVDQVLNRDIRLSFIREMETLFVTVSESDRLRMYQAMQAIEWIRFFCRVPLERLLMRFAPVDESRLTCLVNTVEVEMKELANLLNSGKKIPILLLEALFVFNAQEKLVEDSYDFEKECSDFVSKAAKNLSAIRNFKTSFAIADFVRFTVRDVTWKPAVVESVEDWFFLFKNAWKKRFDDKWSAWNKLHKRAMLEKNMCLFIEKSVLPSLASHPWEGMWLPLTLYRELSICFLKGMFTQMYSHSMMKPLKILLIDGDFYRRENMIEYTDAFSSLEHMQQLLENFENQLEPKGIIGEGFQLIKKEMAATVKGKARLESLMMSVESDAEHIVSLAKASFRSIDSILGGILGVVRGAPYETLVNMASIQGKQNERYRKELESVRQLIRSAYDFLSDADVLETETR